MGHCASYYTVQELDTEMAFEAKKKSNRSNRFGMTLNLDVETGVAWGNYDWYVETQNGRDTLHDTVGTTYLPPYYHTLL